MGEQTHAPKERPIAVLRPKGKHMTGYEAYKLFSALSRHFEGKYDYFKYGTNISLNPETYEKKPSNIVNRSEHLARKHPYPDELEEFILATMVTPMSKRPWIGDMLGNEAQERYVAWQGRTQSLNYNFVGEMKSLLRRTDSLEALFSVRPNEHPEILLALLRKDISLESFVLLDMATDFITRLDRKSALSEDRIWRESKLKVQKYRPFLERRITVKELRAALLQAIRDLGINT